MPSVTLWLTLFCLAPFTTDAIPLRPGITAGARAGYHEVGMDAAKSLSRWLLAAGLAAAGCRHSCPVPIPTVRGQGPPDQSAPAAPASPVAPAAPVAPLPPAGTVVPA